MSVVAISDAKSMGRFSVKPCHIDYSLSDTEKTFTMFE
jgi:hypothetical protein